MGYDSLKRVRKDHYAGAVLILIGLATVYFGRSLEIGTLAHMGSGYFPRALGVIIALIGLIIAIGANKKEAATSIIQGVPGEPIDVLAIAHATAHKGTKKPEWRGWSCIIGGFIAFIVLFKYAGVIPATTGITIISALGERGNTIWSAIWLAVAMNAIVVAVFWYALQMPLHLFWWD